MSNNSNIRLYFELLLIGVITIMFFLLQRSCDKLGEARDYISDVNDTLEVYIDKNGNQVAKINSLESDNANQFLKIQSNDSTIKWLQNTVNDYKGKLASATVGSTTTHSGGSTEVIIIHDTDTVYIDNVAHVFAKYETNWTNKWEVGHIIASKDSIWRDIKIKNEFEITLGEVKNGWFKPKEMEVSITNLNPNTTTQELRSFNVKNNDKTFTIGAYVGYGIGLYDFKPQPYIGVGVGYKLIGIK